MPVLPRGTVTFLFSDVEGSTRLLRELGQEGYGQALADYQRLLRESCTVQGGHEVDTQGDAIFFAFENARDAVTAAAGAQWLLARNAWPEGASLRARIGLHTGEASLTDGRYVGLSVHRAARVCAAAAGGQVLLSHATASMLEDEELGELQLRDLGRHSLKDFQRPVQLHQLEVPGLPGKFPPLETTPRGPRRRHVLLAVGIAALVALAIATPLALIGGGSSGTSTLGPTSVGVIDPGTNKLAALVQLGFKSSLIAAGAGYVWIADPQGSTLTRIDPRTRKRASFGIGGGIPTGIAFGGRSVWVGVNRGHSLAVVEIGPQFGDVRQTIVVASSSTGTFSSEDPVLLAFGAGSLWTLEEGTGEVSRINPKTRVVKVLTEGASGSSIAYGHGAVWLGGRIGVTRLDPVTRATRTLPINGLQSATSTSLAIGPDAVWFAASTQTMLFRIGTRSLVVSAYPVGRGPSGVAVGSGAVWVANSLDGTVSRVDPRAGPVETVRLGASPGGVVAAYGDVWTSPGEPVQ